MKDSDLKKGSMMHSSMREGHHAGHEDLKMPEVKRPSIEGKSHFGHLGHFAQNKHLQRGHNDVAVSSPTAGESGMSSMAKEPMLPPEKKLRDKPMQTSGRVTPRGEVFQVGQGMKKSLGKLRGKK